MIDPVQMLAPLVDAPTGQADPQEAAAQFEELLTRILIKEMRKTLPEDGWLSGAGADIYQGLLDEQLAQQLTDSGGLGLAPALASSFGSSGAATSAGHGTTEALPPVLPVAGARTTSGFGMRTDPLDGSHRHHDGVDLAAPSGTPIRAARPGTVRFAGERGGYGNLVIIDHGDGLETRYGHCATVTVRPGDRVDAGQRVGTVGSTGRSTGSHLHFEVRNHGRTTDPAPWLGLSKN